MSCSASTYQRAFIRSCKTQPRLSSVRCLFRIFDWASSVVSVRVTSVRPVIWSTVLWILPVGAVCGPGGNRDLASPVCLVVLNWYFIGTHSMPQNTSAMPRHQILLKSARAAKTNDPARQAGFRETHYENYKTHEKT